MKAIKSFIGVFPLNALPHLKFFSVPSFFCLNLDYSYEKGSHWIALRVSERQIEIFDSLGFSHLSIDRYPSPLISFLKRFGKKLIIIKTPQLQNYSSNSCGAFVIFYILLRQHMHLDKILYFFSSDLKKNSEIVISVLNKLFL